MLTEDGTAKAEEPRAVLDGLHVVEVTRCDRQQRPLVTLRNVVQAAASLSVSFSVFVSCGCGGVFVPVVCPLLIQRDVCTSTE
jgi:hypothetical protein